MNEKSPQKKSTFALIIAVQFACVLIFLAGVAALKYLKPKLYKRSEKYIETYLFEDTSTDEFLKLFKNED